MSLEAGLSGYEPIDGKARDEVAEILFHSLGGHLTPFSETGRGSRQRLCRCRTSADARAHISYLYRSAMNSPID
jgi:hypothetical protein